MEVVIFINCLFGTALRVLRGPLALHSSFYPPSHTFFYYGVQISQENPFGPC